MILIDHGHVVYDGAVEEIRRRFGVERRMRVEFEGPAPTGLPEGVEEEDRGPERLVLRFRRDAISSAGLVEWLSARRGIVDLAIEEPPIERIIAGIYRRGLWAPEAPPRA
jgi:ABC-2 type transport system ATP-binding protein